MWGVFLKKLKLRQFLQTRFGFFSLLTIVFWLKTVFAYYADFSLGASDILQHFLLFLNPIGTTILLLSIALYIKNPKWSYGVMLGIYGLNSLLLFSNVIYYRQFTDFLTFNTIFSVDKVAGGLGKSTLSLLQWHDVFLVIDLLLLILALSRHWLKIDRRPFLLKKALTITSIGFAVFMLNLTLSESNRPQLLTRTFDRNYIVKYLGLDTFMVYDSIKTAQNNQIRASADGTDINAVLNYTQNHQVEANPTYFGQAKGKNVIIIHLESFQQFLIDMKVDGQEVTPFLNQLYHSQNSLSFANFFHQVGQGKTSDAENMLENSVYGLPEGSVFTSVGTDNTYQAAPSILAQQADYTSAVFHGNVGTFWNRKDVYKNFGYDHFFDANYFDTSDEDASIGYGLKDKLLFAESAKYLEQLQQPFYAKFITITNHYPFTIDESDTDFPRPTTSNSAVNNYFATAHYLDQAVEEFFNYLDKTGLSKNSMIVLYGDHYGLSNSDNRDLAPLLGSSAKEWTAFDNAQLQRVPFMIHMDGLQMGGVQTQYGGEIDVLPTLMHLLGIETNRYVMFGQDLLSTKHQELVPFRNNNFVTNKYTVLGGKGAAGTVYDNDTGTVLETLTTEQRQEINRDQKEVEKALDRSDTLNLKNLLRFYTPQGYRPVDPAQYNYLDQIDALIHQRQALKRQSTSLYSQNGGSTTSLYQTDAPELADSRSQIDTFPKIKTPATQKNKDKNASTTAK